MQRLASGRTTGARREMSPCPRDERDEQAARKQLADERLALLRIRTKDPVIVELIEELRVKLAEAGGK